MCRAVRVRVPFACVLIPYMLLCIYVLPSFRPSFRPVPVFISCVPSFRPPCLHSWIYSRETVTRLFLHVWTFARLARTDTQRAGTAENA